MMNMILIWFKRALSITQTYHYHTNHIKSWNY